MVAVATCAAAWQLQRIRSRLTFSAGDLVAPFAHAEAARRLPGIGNSHVPRQIMVAATPVA